MTVSGSEKEGGGKKSLSLTLPLECFWDPSLHDSRLVILLHLSSVITLKIARDEKKERWKEPAYLSFPIVYLFHGKLTFTSPVTGSSLGSTARAVWLWPRLPSPSLGFMTWL